MLASGVPPNQLCYGATLVSCVRSDMWEEVDNLLEEMEEVGLPLVESVLGSAISACRLPKSHAKTKARHRAVVDEDREGRLGPASQLSLLDMVKEEWAIEERARVQALDEVPLWERSLRLLEKWSPKVANRTDYLFTMTMDVLEASEGHAQVARVYEMMKSAGVPITKSALSFAMRAASRTADAEFALAVLSDAQVAGLDTSQIYNSTLAVCDKAHRHRDAIQVLLSIFNASAPAAQKARLPSVWITRRVISNALDALTKNFSSLFTKIIDGRLAPVEESRAYVREITTALKYTVRDRNLYLSSTGYPMANKLLLDAGDYDTLRGVVNN